MVSASFTFVSCADEEMYSCDKNVDRLIKSNLATYSSMNRTEWKSLPDTLKIPVYRTFSPAQQRLFWQEKISELLSLTSFNDVERNHINELSNYLESNPDLFNADYMDDGNNYEEFMSFFNNWYNYAEQEFNWNRNLVYLMVVSGEEIPDTVISYIMSHGSGNMIDPFVVVTGGLSSCECSKRSDWCDVGVPRGDGCDQSNCDIGRGCGTLFLFECNGDCK